MNDVIITIPAYEPDNTLLELAISLQQVFSTILIIDDGSTKSTEIFTKLELLNGVKVIHHPQNLGKGAAIKTAIATIAKDYPNAIGTITVDADGQHLLQDIINVANTLVSSPNSFILGVRTFGRNVPFRSKLGNLWTCGEFFLLTGKAIKDTQTGLRGIPSCLFTESTNIQGTRYDYEIRALVRFSRHYSVIQVPITTVYLDNNATSHFRPLADTIATQKALFQESLLRR